VRRAEATTSHTNVNHLDPESVATAGYASRVCRRPTTFGRGPIVILRGKMTVSGNRSLSGNNLSAGFLSDMVADNQFFVTNVAAKA